MNLKVEVTKYVAQQLHLCYDDKAIKQLRRIWWQNPRIKATGGLRLTEQGFTCLTNADLKFYKIKRDAPELVQVNKVIIALDNYIDCPFYLTKQDIYVFGDKMAVQLILFSGNVGRFTSAKVRYLEKTLDK